MKILSSFCILYFAFCISLVGCNTNQQQAAAPAPPPQPPPSLVAANNALASNQPDAAIGNAQSYLRSQPTGLQAAEAWYFEGRGYEMKVAFDPGGVQANLSQARTCYLEALQLSPAPSLEGDIRASYSNVAFFQDDYAEAIQQASAAMPLVLSNTVKGNLLLRIGESQQRLSRFTDADQTFRQVEQHYPGTAIAAAAKEREGLRDFYVQLATYSSRDLADKALTSLRASGVVISERSDSKGNTIIDDGPFASYSDAKKVRDQLRGNFPQALIVP